jgi:Flp pilus assembly protein CpaB
MILGVALICGLAAFGLIFNFLKAASAPKNQFVITQKDLNKGKILSAEDLTLSDPIPNVPAQSHYTQLHEALGMEMQQDLAKGSLLNRGMVKKPKELPKAEVIQDVEEIVLPVPPSMRALTFNLSEMENIPQLLKGGDYVDILGTILVSRREREVRTVLRGVLVLSVSRNERKQAETVTIALYPPQVESLLNASKMGKMRLVITQKPADNADWANMGSIEVIRGIQRERKVT